MKNVLLFAVFALLLACEKEPIPVPVNSQSTMVPGMPPEESISDLVDANGDAARGLDLYLGIDPNGIDPNGRACVNCHLSPTGVDIAQFGKTSITEQDAIVVHRALGHVAEADAYHIAAYIKSLDVAPNGNASLATVLGFDSSSGLAPLEIWDGSSPLTVAQINDWDFRNGVQYSFDFPRWFAGDETNELYEDNLDWLPEIDLLTEKGGAISSTYAEYLSRPTKAQLKLVLMAAHQALSEGERHPGEHGYNDFVKAFDYQRWMATLYMQHILRADTDLAFGEELSDYNLAEFSLADGIWDAGNVARRSQDNGSNVGNGQEINNRLLNEVQWLYLGWLTNYGKRNSFETQYIGTALKDFGEQDLASLVILRSIVNRSAHSQRMYDDVFTMGYITSDALFYESVVFGLDYLIEGIRSGDSHFTLTNPQTISISMNYLKNELPDPDLRQFVEEKHFLGVDEKAAILHKIDILYDLMADM